MIKGYLIHCKRLTERLKPSTDLLLSLGIDYQVVHAWDADELDIGTIYNPNHAKLWEDGIEDIMPILVANYLSIGNPACFTQQYNCFSRIRSSHESISAFPWLMHRDLSAGELSVLLKHYYAISSIAHDTYQYGIIFEDDVLPKYDSALTFKEYMLTLVDNQIDYLDLAGGSSLELPSDIVCELPNIKLMVPPRTRCSACYLISRRMAYYLASHFLPFIYPIDWHIQLLLTRQTNFKCYWALDKPFMHGSESGAYRSWRTE